MLSQAALEEQGILKDAFQRHVQAARPLRFETGNGITDSSQSLSTNSTEFGQIDSYILQHCPIVRSLGQLVELQRKPELDAVDEFGQRIAADFIIVHKDSRSTETVVLVIRDEATGYIRSFPLVSRHEDGVIKSVLQFLGRYSSGPCILMKSDNAREIIGACARLGFTSEPSLERRWEECTRALHISSGFQLHSGLWVHTVRFATHALNMYPATGLEGSRYLNAVGSEFTGIKPQLGQLVYYRLDPASRENFQASAAPGIFAGWRFDSGPASFWRSLPGSGLQ